MLTKQTILEILDKPGLQAGINDYCYLLNNLYSTNVAEDAHYQDVFRKFYQMRKFYSDEFVIRNCSAYYDENNYRLTTPNNKDKRLVDTTNLRITKNI